MAQVNAGILDPNAFARGFGQTYGVIQDSMKQHEERQAKNALAALMQKPDDPQAIAAIAQHDPRLAFQMQGQIQERQQAQNKQRDQMIGQIAAAAKDPQTWDQFVDELVQMGHQEAGQFKGRFSPALRAALMAKAGIKDETAEPTSFQRELQAAGIAPGSPEYRQMLESRYAPPWAQPRFVTDPQTGAQGYAMPPGGAAAPQGVQEGATATNPQTGERIVFKGGQWVPLGQGGPGPSGPATFP